MASPFNYSISSFVVSNVSDSNNSSDEFEENSSNDHGENNSEMSVQTDLDTSTLDTDHEEHGFEASSSVDQDSVIYDVDENDTSENSVQTDSENAIEEEQIGHKAKRMKLENEDDQSDGDENVDPSQKCPICLGAWTTTGNHRLCSLRCGHIFGYRCIRQWLNSNNPSANKCPQCNARACIRHIRFLYANKVTSMDNVKIEKIKKQLEEAQLRISKVAKALIKQKKRTRKYKQMCKARTAALVDSDYCFSD